MRRQKSLEQSIQSAQETDKTLRLIQESLAAIDKQLTAYTADRVDAAQVPQEAQVSYIWVEMMYLPISSVNQSICLTHSLIPLRGSGNTISLNMQVNFKRDYFENLLINVYFSSGFFSIPLQKM